MHAYEQIQALFQRLNLEHTDLRAPVRELEDGPEAQAAAAEVQAFLRQLLATLTTLDRAIGKMGMKEALNVLQLRRLTELMQAQNADVENLTHGVEELAKGVTHVAEDTHRVAEAATNMKRAGGESLAAVSTVLDQMQSLEQQANTARDSVANMVQQTREAAEKLKMVRGVAGTSRLLALNAAIQAAHANDKAFAVVAQEMRRLSDRTEQLVKQIEVEVQEMEEAIGDAGAVMSSMAETVLVTGNQAKAASGGLSQVHELLNEVSDAVESIAAVAEEQAAATEQISATARDLSSRIEATAESMNLTRNLAVSELTEEAHEVLGHYDIGTKSDRMRDLLERTCDEVEQIVERAVAQGSVGVEQLWDYDYQEIKGSAIQSLARIFRVDRVPPTGFNPPKYQTLYDQKIDMPLIDLMDRVVREGSLQFCTVMDLNAFTLAHARSMAQDWTGSYERDLAGNRIKRVFVNDVSAHKSVRIALPPALQQKERIDSRDVAGLPGPTDTRSFLIQTYALDSGEVMLAMAMPIYIRGRRWGVIRAGYKPEE